MKMKNKKGMSLIEMLLYVAIMGILIAGITSFIIFNKKISDRNEAINEVEFQSSEIVEVISQTIRNAKSVTEPAFQATGSQLSLTVDAPDSTIIFGFSSGKVTIKRGTASATNLNSDQVAVSNLSFKNLGNAETNGSINFQFDATYLNPGNKSELNYAKTFFGSGSLR